MYRSRQPLPSRGRSLICVSRYREPEKIDEGPRPQMQALESGKTTCDVQNDIVFDADASVLLQLGRIAQDTA